VAELQPRTAPEEEGHIAVAAHIAAERPAQAAHTAEVAPEAVERIAVPVPLAAKVAEERVVVEVRRQAPAVELAVLAARPGVDTTVAEGPVVERQAGPGSKLALAQPLA